MRWPHKVLITAALVLALGLVGVQIWLGEQQLAAQKAEIARQEAAIARQQAEWEAAQARARAHPGQPFLPPPVVQPLPTVYQPPLFFPWFPVLFPLLMAPAAYAVAAEQQRLRKLQQHEEEAQTPYSPEELMENWEFKIIRCPLPLFEQPAFLASVLREEARAGWQLVEKFDGMRVRLKRVAGQPPAADLPAGYDPYRTAVGPTSGVKVHVLLWIFCILCLALVPLFIVMQLHDPIPVPVFWSLIAATSGGAIVLGLFAVRKTAKYRGLTNPAQPAAVPDPTRT